MKQQSEPQDQGQTLPQTRISRLSSLVQPVLYAVGITVLILGLTGIVERTWLSGVEMGLLHTLHMARGVFISLVAAMVVSWMIIKTSPGFLMAASEGEEASRRARLTEGQRTKIYAHWFIAMRWIAVLVAGLLIFVSVQLVEVLPSKVGRPLLLTVVFLAGANLIYMALIRSERGAFSLLLVQGYVDLIILTVLLHFSGGVENPLSTVMIIHVIIGGILLSRRQCYGIAAAGSLLFALLIWAEFAEVLEHYTLFVFPHAEQGEGFVHAAHQPLYALSRAVLQTAILFLTAYFVTTLSERLRFNERRLEAMADRALADRQLLERSLETTGAALRVLGAEPRQCWANNRWNEWFVCPPRTTCQGFEFLNGDGSPARQSLQDGRTRVTEITLESGDCSTRSPRSEACPRTFQVTTAALFDVNGRISQAVELALDVTRQKETQSQMMRAGKLAAVGELAGQIAHEVNNPISIISAKTRLLLSDHRQDVSPKVAQELNKITELSDRVARIAQGLLSYCRPSTGTRARIDLRVPIRKSLAMIEAHAKTANVRIEDELEERMLTVNANENELEQVFLNVFLNALDAMPKGGWLKVSALPDSVVLGEGNPRVAVFIEDTGDGIPEAIRERVFEPFFTTKKEGRGTGLGLSICLGLVRSHGGEIEIESKLWLGTRVTIRLPLERPATSGEQDHG